MKPQILRAAISDEYYTEERCHSLELANSPSDSDLSIARARVEVEGLEACTVELHDVVIIPKGASQRITNTGDIDLIFLAICTPRFHQECYEHLE